MKGDILGKWRLLERIGIGGMAEVFVARPLGTVGAASVVIKRMLPHLVADRAAVSMFLDEGRLGAKLQHENIVAVLEAGEAEGDCFLVLEFVDGADLGVLVSRARSRSVHLPVEHAAFIVARAAQGLHAAHSASLGIVHRDVSPSNILVSRSGDVKIGDFGVARSVVQSAKTDTGMIKGKIAYMSPEQLNGTALDARSDTYALGVVLWELLAGARLHEGKNDAQIITTVSKEKEQPPPPSSRNPAVPAALDALTVRCLHRAKELRPSAGEVKDTIDRWRSTLPGDAKAAFSSWLKKEATLFDADLPSSSPGSSPNSPRRTPVNAAKPLTPTGTHGEPTPVLKKVKTASSKTPAVAPKLVSKAPERKRELILYVEDEPENRDVAELRLKRSYDLLLAATDEEACKLLKERGKELRAILMDIQLKGCALDGIELVKLVRGTLPDDKKPAYAKAVPVLDVPIFFVTAYAARYSEAELLKAGAQKLVTKPVNFSELTLALVDAHLKRAGR